MFTGKSGFITLASILFLNQNSKAQDITEAYNFSNLTVQGTARSMGFGNTLGSVGGDFSSLSVNPAGIGVYRSSEFSITPSIKGTGATSNYLSSTSTDANVKFNFNNAGIVFTDAPRGARYDRSDWKTVSFGVGVNRVADFNHSYTYSGKNTTSSVSQVFESDANYFPDDALANVANNYLGNIGFYSGAIDTINSNTFYSNVPFKGGINQTKNKTTTGGINEVVLTLGGNFKEKLLLGITVGFPVINYHSTSYIHESLAQGNNDPNPSGFRSLSYNQTVDLTGGGVNAKLGAIYKITDYIRVGAAIHTPSFYSLTDVYKPGMTTNFGGTLYESTIENGALLQKQFDYQMTTPWRSILSATFIIKKFGFITADYEYVNYSSMRYLYPEGVDPTTGVQFKAEQDVINQSIQNTYTGASNFRIGGEGILGKYFMVRLGYGYYSNAYSTSGQSAANGYSTERMDVSMGAGFHLRQFFVDLGLVRSMYTSYHQPYSIDYGGVISSSSPQVIPTATINHTINNIALTIGTKLGGYHEGGGRRAGDN